MNVRPAANLALASRLGQRVRWKQPSSRLKSTLRKPRELENRDELLKALGIAASTTVCTGVLCYFLQRSDVDVDYGDIQYWCDRYKEDWYRQPHDWLGSFESLKPWLGPCRDKKHIIHVGCGTSLLAEDMADAWECGEIWNIDVSESCVKAMELRETKHRSKLRWVTGDVRDMRELFQDGYFDCAIDKSTLDSVCDGHRDADAARYVSEVARILSDTGVFVVFSFSPPAARLRHLQNSFSCDVQIAENQCFVYTCYKSTRR